MSRDTSLAWSGGPALACALLCGCGGGDGEGTGATTVASATGPTTANPTGSPTGDPTGDPTGGPDPGESSTGEPFPECEGIDLQQDGVLDLDIPPAPAVVVSGAIRLNGGTMPDATGSRGQIVIESKPAHGSPHVVTYALAATGPETYSQVVTAGTATIRWVPPMELCASEPDGPFPCTGGVLLSGVVLSDSGVLDLDVPAVTVSGNVTQNGAAMPNEGEDRGHLEFRGGEQAVATPAFGDAGPVTYAVTVFPGAHDIDFVGNPARCGVDGAAVPCNTGAVARAAKLSASGVLDLDVRAVAVAGKVTLKGGVVPDAAVDRGMLRWVPSDPAAGGEAMTAAFGAAGPVDYTLAIVAGTYDVELVGAAALCDGEAPPFPCQGGRLLAGVNLASSGVLDVDVPMIAVSGAVRLAGAALPDASGPRGSIVFSRDDGGSASVALDASGPVNYVLGLLPGRQSITFAAEAGLCDGVTAPPVPCTGAALQTVDLATDGVLDVDLGIVKVSGKVTLDGAALPDGVGPRGSIAFARDGGAASVALKEAGAVTYALSLSPGTYDIAYQSPEGACEAGAALPCAGGKLLAGLGLQADGVLDLDIPTIALSGLVTHAGAALPDLADPRGGVRWTRLDGDGAVTLDLEATGPGSYALTLMPGRWVVEHAANAELCADAPPALPCVDQVLIGCSDP